MPELVSRKFCCAINMREPPSPTTVLGSLLLMLIDRYIIFEWTNEAIRETSDSLSSEKRLEERSSTMQRVIEEVMKIVRNERSRYTKSVSTDKIEDSVDKEPEPKLWTRSMSLIPSNELDLSFTKPWFVEEWLGKHLSKESWPPKVKEISVRVDATDTPSQQSTIVG